MEIKCNSTLSVPVAVVMMVYMKAHGNSAWYYKSTCSASSLIQILSRFQKHVQIIEFARISQPINKIQSPAKILQQKIHLLTNTLIEQSFLLFELASVWKLEKNASCKHVVCHSPDTIANILYVLITHIPRL